MAGAIDSSSGAPQRRLSLGHIIARNIKNMSFFLKKFFLKFLLWHSLIRPLLFDGNLGWENRREESAPMKCQQNQMKTTSRAASLRRRNWFNSNWVENCLFVGLLLLSPSLSPSLSLSLHLSLSLSLSLSC